MENFKNKKTISHESFGMVSLSRTYTGQAPYFFGTDMQPNSYITLKICKNCELTYDDIIGRRPYASNKVKDQVVEVRMTSTQFADMITSIGMGDGTPCTITKVTGEYVPQYNDNVQGIFEYEYENVIKSLHSLDDVHKSAEAEIRKLTAKLPKKTQEEINSIMLRLKNSVTSTVPFHLRKVASAAEQISARAKGEIASYMTLAKNIAVHQIESHPSDDEHFMLDHEFNKDNSLE